MLELAWGAGTDTGRRRQRNEDAYLATPRLFAVADGMGGHERGDVAAQLAIETLRQLAGGTPEVHEPAPPPGPDPAPEHRPVTVPAATARTAAAAASAASAERLSRAQVLDAVRQADRTITAEASDEPERPMGTTLCGLGVLDDHAPASLLVFNVGDSRIYRFRAEQLDQLTHDHSLVQELVDDGLLLPHEAELHPERNVITRSLGAGELLEVDWWTIDPEVGDRYLLCSDGLVKEVDDGSIRSILADGSPPQDASDRLIDAALHNGGRDNVTVVVIDITAFDAAPGGAPSGDLHAMGGDTNPRPAEVAEPTNPRAQASGATDVRRKPRPDRRRPPTPLARKPLSPALPAPSRGVTHPDDGLVNTPDEPGLIASTDIPSAPPATTSANDSP